MMTLWHYVLLLRYDVTMIQTHGYYNTLILFTLKSIVRIIEAVIIKSYNTNFNFT